jgi:hypothetical protein
MWGREPLSPADFFPSFFYAVANRTLRVRDSFILWRTKFPEQLADDFAARLASAESDLRAITELEATEAYKPDAWTRKKVLGHLIDSAVKNRVRFVMAALPEDVGVSTARKVQGTKQE